MAIIAIDFGQYRNGLTSNFLLSINASNASISHHTKGIGHAFFLAIATPILRGLQKNTCYNGRGRNTS